VVNKTSILYFLWTRSSWTAEYNPLKSFIVWGVMSHGHDGRDDGRELTVLAVLGAVRWVATLLDSGWRGLVLCWCWCW
jgi:hypothetical protein